MSRLLFRDVEVRGQLVDVRFLDGVVDEVARGLETRDEEVIDGGGGALLPGLHDHHLHLLAMAAARTSVDCSGGLAALEGADGSGWLRGVAAAESVDRVVLDRLVPDRPVRLQHRSGAMWMLNSHALREVAHVLDHSDDVERDASGEPTGRLWRYDERLRAALPAGEHSAALTAVADDLLGFGITSVTDATPALDARAVAALVDFPLPVTMLGDPDGMAPEKIVVADHDLPSLGELSMRIRMARDRRRAVAVHAVTRESLLLALAALDEVGRVNGDRIEHAAVVPDPAALRGLRVVTQPGFIADRGDDYVRDVHPEDLPCLYRFGSLITAGVEAIASSDAPYGPLDPWMVIHAAATRLAPSGAVVGASERVPAQQVLAGYLQDSGGTPRQIAPSEHTGVALLDMPLAQVLSVPCGAHVVGAWAS